LLSDSSVVVVYVVVVVVVVVITFLAATALHHHLQSLPFTRLLNSAILDNEPTAPDNLPKSR
jgi:hypothetical protein